MWVIAVYDCPMTSPEARHDYTVFRKSLLRANFIQLQNSLYVRHFPSLATAEACISRLRCNIPERAQLAFFLVTDKQYAMTQEYFGENSVRKKPVAPNQIELF
ncbi:CRISPR-associated endonuclease Cas2 [Pseudomonas sp. PDM28]|uniref:CRISPR-associated endonuclease Cas2 n=1 Tax=Pseudomonas sp. PDM28 TaxID=2854770 RepID=UPI001C483AAB|nr:CRISPR-associated endonuclease Cas2 [Pseudomonas sp. PDM28]MBV7552011.1 CRISPR-associated endonuclease Cas2 [Pseudomonas sp. PDM28]